MGFSTIFATIAFVIIFIAGMVYFATVQRGIAQTAQTYNDQVHNAKLVAGQDIEISTASYSVSPVIPWIDTLYSEFILGNISGGSTVLGSGSVEILSAPYSSSTYDSQVIDTGYASTNFSTITWTSLEPALTNITFKAKSGASLAAIQAASFTGPDGTAGSEYTSSGDSLNETLDENRFFQYRAYLNTGDITKTPTLQQTVIGIQRPVGVITLNVTSTGSAKLVPNETDVYVNSMRVSRNVTQRTLHLYDSVGQALWDPGEVVELNIFQTLSSSTSVSVANDAAQDATVVN